MSSLLRPWPRRSAGREPASLNCARRCAASRIMDAANEFGGEPQASEERSGRLLAAADRRRDPRLDLNVAMTMRGPHNFYQGLSENVSEGGVFVATQEEVAIG